MIARRGRRTRLPDARSHAVLAGSARPLRYRQRRRDPDAAAEVAVLHRTNPHAAALAHPTCRPTADLPAPTASGAGSASEAVGRAGDSSAVPTFGELVGRACYQRHGDTATMQFRWSAVGRVQT